jgi:hypothetical protein
VSGTQEIRDGRVAAGVSDDRKAVAVENFSEIPRDAGVKDGEFLNGVPDGLLEVVAVGLDYDTRGVLARDCNADFRIGADDHRSNSTLLERCFEQPVEVRCHKDAN